MNRNSGERGRPMARAGALLRSTLTLLGVPFENVGTHDVDSGQHVEVGVEDGLS